MVRHISQGSAFGRNVDHQVCCWPTCSAALDEDFPLCPRHTLDAYLRAKATVDRVLGGGVAALARPIAERPGYVYFLSFRDRIKIGFSTCLVSRFSALPHEEVLGYVAGTMADEKRTHAAFAHLRENGEWFRAESDLLDFIEDVDESGLRADAWMESTS